MSVLVDSSIWVTYFRKGINNDDLEYLIDQNLILINDLILSELVPFLKVQNKLKLIRLLNEIERLPLLIDWSGITNLQTSCLKKGISGIGIPDLIIAQNAIDNKVMVFSHDKDFIKLQTVSKLCLYLP